MCGIAGVYYFDPTRRVDSEKLRTQTDTLVHRGPDGGGVWTAPGIGLGHRRLSIIDIDGGAQPMACPNMRFVISFNGEIYNYREVRELLRGKGIQFVSDSDTEVLLASYAQWGPSCVNKLNGMFAFAIYDRKNHELFLARDRLGQKPLYYYQDREKLVFASELKAILADPMIPRQVNKEAVADFFALAYVPSPKTIFESIHKLPAATSMLLRGGPAPARSYWDLNFGEVDNESSLEEHATELRELLSDSVKLRMRSDVPLGAFLSGGLDSSAVVAAMRAQGDGEVLTQAVGFADKKFDERSYARTVADHFKTRHSEQLLQPDAAEFFPQLSHFYDEPFGDSSAVPTYYLCQETKKSVTVALSGDGGDEPFAGYDHYAMHQWTDGIRKRVPRVLRLFAQKPLMSMMQLTRYHKGLHELGQRAFLSAYESSDRNAYHHLLPQPYRYRELLSPGFLAHLDGYDPFSSIRDLYQRSGSSDPVSRMQYCDIKSYLCDDILVKVDRASMAHSLEVRSPLLDHRIMELAARIPLAHRMQDGQGKLVLAQAVDKWIAKSHFQRPKQGFAVPLDAWLKGPLASRLEEHLVNPSQQSSGVISSFAAKRMSFESKRGLARHGHQLWSALNFETWFERYVGRNDLPHPETESMRNAKPTLTVTLD